MRCADCARSLYNLYIYGAMLRASSRVMRHAYAYAYVCAAGARRPIAHRKREREAQANVLRMSLSGTVDLCGPSRPVINETTDERYNTISQMIKSTGSCKSCRTYAHDIWLRTSNFDVRLRLYDATKSVSRLTSVDIRSTLVVQLYMRSAVRLYTAAYSSVR